MEIKLMKDLRDDSKEIPCKLVNTEIVVPEKEADSVKLKLRKFRTCLNLLNAKLGVCLDDGDSEKVMAEVKEWLAVVTEEANKVLSKVEAGKDEETDKMAEAVSSGLQVGI